ncbi:ABC transporter permease subunit [Desulfovibrio sp. OttesenSCG-928-A18]|nr:ABC transporter permease subunit [Desulfovibrio sp. OttesenSCG-928-A18]
MRRLVALIRKESLQILRDPSSILIAFVLPAILLFIFGYGVNLDSNRMRIGLVLEDSAPDIASLATAFGNSGFFDLRVGRDRREFEEDLVAGRLRGIVVIPRDFTAKGAKRGGQASLQVISDGSEPNIAFFVQNYAQGVLQVWMRHQNEDYGAQIQEPMRVEPRFWYNEELKSRNFLIPGSIAVTMTLIGTLLTALVIAREWERGTMEALMATPVTIFEILLGKLIPYFLLGLGSMTVCWLAATLWYEVPFRGSFFALMAATSCFLLTALGQGLLISSFSKNQFLASQLALMSAFLPALMLSGFVFEIASMVPVVRGVSYIVAARYFVSSLQTLFLTGDIWPLFIRAMLAMLLISAVFFIFTAKKTVKRLDA